MNRRPRIEAWTNGNDKVHKYSIPTNYDALLEAFLKLRDENERLKHERNEQREKIRQLSTKLIRLTQDLKRHNAVDFNINYLKNIESVNKVDKKTKNKVVNQQNALIEMLRARLIETERQLQEAIQKNEQAEKVIQQMSGNDQRTNAANEMELLSLQREIRDKNAHIQLQESKYEQLESNFKLILTNHREMLEHLEVLKQQITKERQNNVELNNKLQLAELNALKIKDSMVENQELKKEIAMLKERNRELENTVLQEQKFVKSKKITELKKKIETLKEELKKMNNLNQQQFMESQKKDQTLKENQKKIEDLMEETSKQKIKIMTLENETKLLKEKLEEESARIEKYKTTASAFEVKFDGSIKEKQLLESTVTSMRAELANKEKMIEEQEYAFKIKEERMLKQIEDLKNEIAKSVKRNQELEKMNETLKEETRKKQLKVAEFEERIGENQRELTESQKELEKAHELLSKVTSMQPNYINPIESTEEMIPTETKMSSPKGDNEMSTGTKISPKENDESTKGTKMSPKKRNESTKGINESTKGSNESTKWNDEQRQLEKIEITKEENFFELHLHRITLIRELFPYDNLLPVFISFNFFNYETECTTPKTGTQIDLQFDAKYKIKMNKLFLYYIYNRDLKLDLDIVHASEYEPFAECYIHLKQLIQQKDLIRGTVDFKKNDEIVGKLEYSMKLENPIPTIVKNIEYIDHLRDDRRSTLNSIEIMIQIISCIHLKTQNSYYICYKFFDFSTHKTMIKNGSNVKFDDIQIYPIHESKISILDEYFSNNKIIFAIMDSVKHVILGSATITLRSLRFTNEIYGTFDLKDENDDHFGKLLIRIAKSDGVSRIDMKADNENSLDLSFSRFQIQHM